MIFFTMDKENKLGHFGAKFVDDTISTTLTSSLGFQEWISSLTISRTKPFQHTNRTGKMMMKSVLLFSSALMLTEANRPLLRRTRRVAFAEFGRGIDPQKEAEK